MATKVIYFWQNVFSKISSVLVGHQPIPNNSISNIKVEFLKNNLHTLKGEGVEMVNAITRHGTVAAGISLGKFSGGMPELSI